VRAAFLARATGAAVLLSSASLAQTPPTTAAVAPPPVRTEGPALRAIPDGPGKAVAELQGLDKVTARTRRFYAPVGESTAFGTLAITVGDCLVNTPEASPEAVAYLTIVDHKPGQPEQKLFAGWMFASTPSISAMDDGVYDVRVLACTRTQGSAPAPSSR
jgi:hypothetical protein